MTYRKVSLAMAALETCFMVRQTFKRQHIHNMNSLITSLALVQSSSKCHCLFAFKFVFCVFFFFLFGFFFVGVVFFWGKFMVRVKLKAVPKSRILQGTDYFNAFFCHSHCFLSFFLFLPQPQPQPLFSVVLLKRSNLVVSHRHSPTRVTHTRMGMYTWRFPSRSGSPSPSGKKYYGAYVLTHVGCVGMVQPTWF